MLRKLESLPILDETWYCHGGNSRSHRKPTLLVWQRGHAVYGSLVTGLDVAAHARALEELFAQHGLPGLPRNIHVEKPGLARLFRRLLTSLRVEVSYVTLTRTMAVDDLAAGVIISHAAREAMPFGASAEATERMRDALLRLRNEHGWLHLPMNLSIVVHGLDPAPFGILIHADCCPGFTVVPIGDTGNVLRDGLSVLRLQRNEPLGVPGRWPFIVEERSDRRDRLAFQGRQHALTALTFSRVLAALEIVVAMGRASGVIDELTLEHSVDAPLRVRLERRDLGVYTVTVAGSAASRTARANVVAAA